MFIKISLSCFLYYNTRVPNCIFKFAFINKITVNLPLIFATILTTTQILFSGLKIRVFIPGDIWFVNVYQNIILVLIIFANTFARFLIWFAAWILLFKFNFPPKIKSAITAIIWFCLTFISAKFIVVIYAFVFYKFLVYWTSGVFDGFNILVDIILWVIIAINYNKLHNYVLLLKFAMVL